MALLTVVPIGLYLATHDSTRAQEMVGQDFREQPHRVGGPSVATGAEALWEPESRILTDFSLTALWNSVWQCNRMQAESRHPLEAKINGILD